MFYFSNKLITMMGSLCLLYGLTLTESIAEDSKGLLEINEIVWTDGVDLETKNPMKVYQETAPNGFLCLWMKIRGNQQALEELRQNGKLPIRHKWFSYIGTRPYFDSTKEPTDTIDLSVGKHEVLSELNAELDNRGFFEWRVWSSKKNVRAGWWRVDVVYADNQPVMCGKEPCVYNILVKD